MQVQDIVCGMLLERGVYSPVELLHAGGLLSEEGHEAWLRGERASLDEALPDPSAPLWRGVGLALEGRDFDPGDPDGHASWAFRQCLDWEAVKRTVCGVPDFVDRPVLVGRLAEAEYALHDRVEAVRLWFALCATAPRHFAALVRRPDFPDTGMAEAWRQAMDTDELAEDLSPEWFPAWMLIRERGLARRLPEAAGADGPARAFNLLRELRRGGETDERCVQYRAGLKAVHPGLFESYMRTLP